MLVRLPTTVIPVLGGVVAGVTVTVSSVFSDGSRADGLAVPIPEMLAGSPPHRFSGDAVFRGMGPSMMKSAELLLVSMQPLPLRMAAVAFESDGVAAVSKQLAVP